MIYTEPYPSFGEDDREALRALIHSVCKPGCRMLEIGSWLGGGSTQVFIEELAAVAQAKLYCVDNWRGSANVARHREVAAGHDIFATFLHHVREAGGDPFVLPLMMNSVDAAAISANGCFDLVFIDGDHSYASTRHDIELWRPKVRGGGILCGHDCECRPRGPLGDAIRAAQDKDHIAGAGTPFAAIHPGVVLAVDEAFNGTAHLWAETPLARRDGSSGRATLWDVVTPLGGNHESRS